MSIILACFPVAEVDRGRLLEIVKEPLPSPYTGSIQASCAECMMAVWVGPRQQQVVDAVRLCPWCTAQTAQE